MSKEKTALIIGAGPAGLTAAYELLDQTNIRTIIFEETNDFGGLSRTVNYKGNYIDIGGHRFFSKSDKVMDWWKNILPVEGDKISNNISGNSIDGPDPEKHNRVMLVRSRLSRIYFLRKFFSYPVSINLKTIKNLGFSRLIKIACSYIKIRLFPIKNEESLEDFFINRFGKELYTVFFKDYTEKVWGVPCREIKAEWGSQRIKGLSVVEALKHAVKHILPKKESLDQKNTETSLIEKFLYPKYGPGQMWKEVARLVEKMGGEIHLNHKVTGIQIDNNNVKKIKVRNILLNEDMDYSADYIFSTMPVKDLINSIHPQVPDNVDEVANSLIYRDFITVGLLLDKLLLKNETGIITTNNIIPDNWIYIQEPDVKLGRIQIFNNWSPYMVKDNTKVWIGLEYFCTEGDDLWLKSEKEFIEFAINELCDIDIINKDDVSESVMIRMLKTYPAYLGGYERFDIIRDYTDRIENLFLIGRNGMHRYNNQDHSMLTAMTAVGNIIKGIKTKNNIWSVNTEEDYHEEK